MSSKSWVFSDLLDIPQSLFGRCSRLQYCPICCIVGQRFLNFLEEIGVEQLWQQKMNIDNSADWRATTAMFWRLCPWSECRETTTRWRSKVMKQQKLSEELDRRWQRFPVVWKRTRWCWQKKGKAECCFELFLFVFLYLVLDLNFFPKALSSSGTDRVRVKEPSDSDLTTRALRWGRKASWYI